MNEKTTTENRDEDKGTNSFSIENKTDFSYDDKRVAIFNPSDTLVDKMNEEKSGEKIKFTIDYQKNQYILSYDYGEWKGASPIIGNQSTKANNSAALSQAFRNVESQILGRFAEKQSDPKTHLVDKTEVLAKDVKVEKDEDNSENIDSGVITTDDTTEPSRVNLADVNQDVKQNKKKTTKN